MRLTTLGGLALLFLPYPVTAQQPLADVSTFRRPRLESGADTNSWVAYYRYGAAHVLDSPEKSEAAFVWAARIDPTRAEPLYARWVAYWTRNPLLFYRYHGDTGWKRLPPAIAQVESLKVRAMLRNPFVTREAEVVLYERIVGGPWSWDRFNRAFLLYTSRHYQEAVRLFNEEVRSDSTHYWVRFYAALCHVATQHYDSGATQISLLLDEVRRRAEAHTSSTYESQEVLLYGLGVLHLMVGDTAAARETLGQALTENLAFYPAHALLGDVDLALGDSAPAVAEYAQAMEFGPEDGVLHYRYARLLGEVGRLPEAESEMRRAIELEPFFAQPYLGLALVLENRGDRAGALEQYHRYLERTYRSDPRIGLARERVKALSQ